MVTVPHKIVGLGRMSDYRGSNVLVYENMCSGSNLVPAAYTYYTDSSGYPLAFTQSAVKASVDGCLLPMEIRVGLS